MDEFTDDRRIGFEQIALHHNFGDDTLKIRPALKFSLRA